MGLQIVQPVPHLPVHLSMNYGRDYSMSGFSEGPEAA